MSELDRIVLSWPTLLSMAVPSGESAAPRSWTQVARTGSFVSNRYGEFSITREDLAQMLNNFRNITPKAPTELPVDYDHLSMTPARPHDGIAAGWMKQLELRANGDELWAEVEWTPDGAKRIQNKEYRFVSPSFVKEYVGKDGKKIGTTLLAAAITNHPFLESMQALTLYSFSMMGDWAASSDVLARPTPDRIAQEIPMSAKDPTTELMSRTTTIALERGLDRRSALLLASRELPDMAEAHRELIGEPAAKPGALTARFEELVTRVKRERKVDQREAIHLASRLDPVLAQGYADGR